MKTKAAPAKTPQKPAEPTPETLKAAIQGLVKVEHQLEGLYNYALNLGEVDDQFAKDNMDAVANGMSFLIQATAENLGRIRKMLESAGEGGAR